MEPAATHLGTLGLYEHDTPSLVVSRTLVLDTSALMAGRPLGPDEDTLIPLAVLEELRPGGRDRRHLDHLLAAGARTTDATAGGRKRVRDEATRAGDLPRLSETDIDVLAIAYELGATIATDDYTIQNVAKRLGVAVQPIQQQGITEAYTFVTRCTGCRRELDKPSPECPVCGSPTRTVKNRNAPNTPK